MMPKPMKAVILTAGDRVARISGTDTLTPTLPSGFMPTSPTTGQRNRSQPVQRRPPSLGTGQLVGLEREQLLDLERRRGIREAILPQIPVLPMPSRIPPGAQPHPP